MVDDERDELDDHVDELINVEYRKLLQGDIGLCTCQLLRHDAATAVPLASGVFIFLDDNFYLLTAFHVIEDWSDSNKLFVQIGQGYVSITGKGCGTIMDKERKLDTAYVKLNLELIPYLVMYYRFLPLNKILHHKKVFDEPNYCAFGYPVINKRKESGKAYGSAYFLRASYDKVFEYCGLDPLAHYALEFSGKAMNIRTNKLDKIRTEHYGLSGCGLWYIDMGFNDETGEISSDAYLIGIMAEFRRSKYDCLIGNGIEIILTSISNNEKYKYKPLIDLKVF